MQCSFLFYERLLLNVEAALIWRWSMFQAAPASQKRECLWQMKWLIACLEESRISYNNEEFLLVYITNSMVKEFYTSLVYCYVLKYWLKYLNQLLETNSLWSNVRCRDKAQGNSRATVYSTKFVGFSSCCWDDIGASRMLFLKRSRFVCSTPPRILSGSLVSENNAATLS